MRSRGRPALVALLLGAALVGPAGAPAAPAGVPVAPAGVPAAPAGVPAAVSFGAAVIAPVGGPAFAAANLTGLAPVRGAWALTLTRTPDATSPRFQFARLTGIRFRSIRLAWSSPGGVASLCLDDVAVTSYARRPVPGGPGAVEHLTLVFAAAFRAALPDACRARPRPWPVVVRLFSAAGAGGGLHARVDCLLARCTGALRLLCPAQGCPAGGLVVGAFSLGAGESTVRRVTLPRPAGGRHPTLTAAVRLAGAHAPILAPVVVDPLPPARLPRLISSAPSASSSPLPAPPTGTPGAGPPATPGAGSGPRPPGPDTGPVLGSPGGGPPSSQVETTLALSCDGPRDRFTGVHGVLGPSLSGLPIEVDYVPVDPAAPTIVHNLTTGSGGSFKDAAGAPFVQAVAIYPGDDSRVGSYGFCP